ncbi:hypothetical protein [Hasllibacter sp. MH4015]|uniref:hypothetical protein n=1 Tax=Hasllibacter sp. MH4015 TaxID=2854029 RepID=UPI001CD22CA1|nr:hypothetical protein [Hasllibacter sp. MH4015]
MTDTKILTFSRRLGHPPGRVLHALTDAKARMTWGPPDADMVVLIEGQPDPAPGIRETSTCGPRENPYVTVETDWILLDQARVSYAETLSAEGEAFATSLAVFDMAATEAGTDLDVTILVASFAGPEVLPEVEGGWTFSLKNIARYLDGTLT